MEKEHDTPETGLSRRDMLQVTGLAAAATALAPLSPRTAEAQPGAGAGAIGPGPVKLTLKVNGKDMENSVEPRVTLLDALRNYLDVTGCKRVCDRGTCGACTVQIDGKVVYSCSMLAVEAQGKSIKTAESLVDGGKLDAVPDAFHRFDAQQCGFCTPGFVVAMKTVFEKNAKPTPQEVEHGLAGNICRCGTYEQMRDAIYDLCKQNRRS